VGDGRAADAPPPDAHHGIGAVDPRGPPARTSPDAGDLRAHARPDTRTVALLGSVAEPGGAARPGPRADHCHHPRADRHRPAPRARLDRHPDAHAQGEGPADADAQADEDQVSPDQPPFPDRLRAHFADEGHLYGVLLAAMADDWERGGVSRELFEGWEDVPARQFPQLRLLAGLFRIVLRGEAPQLVRYYPALGGDADPGDAWADVRPVLLAHRSELRDSLAEAPQTNEPGRAAALLVGLTEALRRTGLRRVRLLEPGASAGLNLLVDHYRLVGEDWAAGPESSPLVIEGCGAPGLRPVAFTVLERRGCDVAPVDAATEEGARYLTSFVWPWMTARHARLAAALDVVRAHPVTVDRARGASWVDEQLAAAPADDVLTVVWNSVTRLYWPAEESRALESAVARARTRMPLVHVGMEHPRPVDGSEPVPRPGDDVVPEVELDGEVLATCGHHGPPVRWLR
jgi:hypothetical protein